MVTPPRPPPTMDWTPVRVFPPFTLWATHKLEQVGPERMVFVESIWRKLSNATWLVGPSLFFVTALLLTLAGVGGETSWLLPLSIAALVIGFMFSRASIRKPIFDRERKAYWAQSGWSGRAKDATPLARIRALQLVEADWGQLELNLVLDDGSRHNVLVHGDHPALRKDAARLAVWLGIQVLSKS
jgi:hypothetical protein